MSENAESTTYQQPTLFAADSLASLTVLPGSAEAQKMTATSGRNIAALLPNADPVGCLVRMCLESERLFSTRCYLTWMIWDTPRGRLLFRLAPSMPRIDGRGSSLLPTPTDSSKGGGSSRSGDRKNEIPTLQGMARVGELDMWPTPQVSRGDYQNSHGRIALKLSGAVKLFPTPKSSDATGGPAYHKPPGRMGGFQLKEMVRGGQLNPRWVEWLMGFPDGWTDLSHSETP